MPRRSSSRSPSLVTGRRTRFPRARASAGLARPRDGRERCSRARSARSSGDRGVRVRRRARVCARARRDGEARKRPRARRDAQLRETETSEPSSAVHRNLLESLSRVANHTIDRTRDEHRFAKHETDRPTVRFTNLQAPNPRAGSIRHQRTSRGSANLRSGDKISSRRCAPSWIAEWMSDRKNTTAIPRMRGCTNIDIDIIDDRGFDRFVAPAAIALTGPSGRDVRLRLQGASRRVVTSRRAHAMALSLAHVAPAAQVRRVSHRRARRARRAASRTRARRRERRRRAASDRMAVGAASRVVARPGRDDARRRRTGERKIDDRGRAGD